jgi:hypothetical protein
MEFLAFKVSGIVSIFGVIGPFTFTSVMGLTLAGCPSV